MVSRIIATLCAWLLSATLALAATPSTATVTGTLYSGSGSPLANATVIFNTPQQNVGGNTLGPSILSTRTNSSGVLTPITLVQSSVVQITINNGMVITGIVPASGSVDISQVLTGTAITGIGLQVNGVNVLSTSTINFENGSGITVSNPSAGNIQFALSGSGIVTSVGASFTGGLISVAGSPITSSGTLAFTVAGTSGGIPYFDSSTSWASSGALTANLPVIGGGAGVAPTVGTRSGDTTEYVTTTGAQTSGNCVQIDASCNHVASVNSCSSSGGLIQIEAKTFTANASTFTFAATLDGNTDGTYELIGKIKSNSGSGAFDYVALRPNGQTSNQLSAHNFISGASTVSGGALTFLPIGFAKSGAFFTFRCTIHARISSNSVTFPVEYECMGGTIDGSTRYTFWLTGQDTTNANVVSLTLRGVNGSGSDVANILGDGSELYLYKYEQ